MEEQNTQQQNPTPGVTGTQADPADVQKNKTMAILAYFIFFLPLLTDSKDSKFAKFHANQSLVLLLAWILGSFVCGMIPFIGWFLLGPILGIICIVFFVMGIINASNGQMKELPLIGKIHLLDK